MLCFKCGGEQFVTKLVNVKQLYQGKEYIVNTPVSECVDCGWQSLALGQTDELLERMRGKLREDAGLCSHCQKNPASAPHACPYAEEIENDSETQCTCCAECSHDCAMEI